MYCPPLRQVDCISLVTFAAVSAEVQIATVHTQWASQLSTTMHS